MTTPPDFTGIIRGIRTFTIRKKTFEGTLKNIKKIITRFQSFPSARNDTPVCIWTHALELAQYV